LYFSIRSIKQYQESWCETDKSVKCLDETKSCFWQVERHISHEITKSQGQNCRSPKYCRGSKNNNYFFACSDVSL